MQASEKLWNSTKQLLAFQRLWPKDKGAAKIRQKEALTYEIVVESNVASILASIEDRSKPSTDMTTSAIEPLI